MSEILIFILAVAGSGLVLTQSSITAPFRDWLDACAKSEWAAELRGPGQAARIASKIASCPMCAGFWLGLAWAYALGVCAVRWLPALGFVGSLSSAVGVASWLLIVEAKSALELWRYLNTPKGTNP